MNAQTIVTPSGERLVILPEAEFDALLEASEDAADLHAVRAFRRDLAAGNEELVPASVVDRILSGENRIRVWRAHRAMTGTVLTREAGIAQNVLSQMETGKRDGTVETVRKLAAALSVTIDDLVG